jgi:translocator protein
MATIATAGLPPATAAAVAASALVWPAVAGRRWGPQTAPLWYAQLRKPRWQPPDIAFPFVWTAIDGALAYGAYRLLRRPPSPEQRRAVGWWALNVGLIGGWSALFFGRPHRLGASTVLAAAMAGSGAAYVAQARRVDPPAAAAGLPFVGWVAFAAVLTATLWRANR